jgi:hypothetical protein
LWFKIRVEVIDFLTMLLVSRVNYEAARRNMRACPN